MGARRTKIAEAHKEAIGARRHLDKFNWEMNFVVEWDIPELMNLSIATGDRLTLVEQDQVKNREEIQMLKNQMQSANISATLAAMDKDRIEKTQDQDGKQIRELRHRLTSANIRLEVTSVDRYRLECELYSVRAQMLRGGVYVSRGVVLEGDSMEKCLTKEFRYAWATYGDADPP
ncbi:hypothetical protein Tco_1557049 [Tanacetum coccineum]